MAGMLQNRSIPSALEIEMAAAIDGQWHECECGCRCKAQYVATHDYKAPKCDCGSVMHPLWYIRDRRGAARGVVAGATHRDALQSAVDSVEFCRLKSFTVSPAVFTRNAAIAATEAR